MKNENRAAFGRAPEPIDYAFDLPLEDDGHTGATSTSAQKKIVTRFARGIVAWFNRRRTALALMELSDEQLKDIGISRCQAWGGYSRYRRSSTHDLEKRSL
jgi:uncharacterized protein YjiS (DUF1127 family)